MHIEVKGLEKSYDGVPVLQNITFTLDDGVTCLMAPSGTGKTTLLRILLGLERPDSGTVKGLENARLSAVFQEDRLLEQLDAKENLRFALGAAYEEKKAENLLAELGLFNLGGRPVRYFSGGMRRRLALARALSVPFDFLALDEPFTGLDDENRMRAIALLRTCSAGRPVLLVTHDIADAQGLNAKVITLIK